MKKVKRILSIFGQMEILDEYDLDNSHLINEQERREAIMLILTIIFLVGFCVSFTYFFIIKKKTAKMQKAFDLLQDKSNVKSSLAFGAGLAGMSMLETYLAFSNHADVLSTMEDRFNHALGEDATSLDWMERVATLEAKGKSSLQGDYNAYVGEAGEIASIGKIAGDDIEVTQFESRIHKDDDLITENGDTISVKSLGEDTSLKSIIDQHPNSDHYMINSEKYQAELANGNVEKYEAQGIKIEDGGFSHGEHQLEIKEAYSDISDAMNVMGDIPILSVAFFGVNAVKEVQKLVNAQQSEVETGINLTTSAGKIAVGGVTAMGGSYVGSAIGTMLMPGVGTLAGGIIGGACTWLVAGAVASGIADWWKYGKIKNALIHFSNKGDLFLNPRVIAKKFFDLNAISKEIEKQSTLYGKYKSSLSVFSLKAPTPQACFSTLAYQELESQKEIIISVCVQLQQNLYEDVCIALKKMGRISSDLIDDELISATVGEVIVKSKKSLNLTFEGEDKKQFKIYSEQIKSRPNHPYKAFKEPELVIQSIVSREYSKVISDPLEPREISEAKIVQVALFVFGVMCLIGLVISLGSTDF